MPPLFKLVCTACVRKGSSRTCCGDIILTGEMTEDEESKLLTKLREFIEQQGSCCAYCRQQCAQVPFTVARLET